MEQRNGRRLIGVGIVVFAMVGACGGEPDGGQAPTAEKPSGVVSRAKIGPGEKSGKVSQALCDYDDMYSCSECYWASWGDIGVDAWYHAFESDPLVKVAGACPSAFLEDDCDPEVLADDCSAQSCRTQPECPSTEEALFTHAFFYMSCRHDGDVCTQWQLRTVQDTHCDVGACSTP